MGPYFDETFASDGSPCAPYRGVLRGIDRLSADTFSARAAAVDRAYGSQGITYSHGGVERAFPFDLLTPRGEGHQRVQWTRLSTRPGAELREHADPCGNVVHWFQVTEPSSRRRTCAGPTRPRAWPSAWACRRTPACRSGWSRWRPA